MQIDLHRYSSIPALEGKVEHISQKVDKRQALKFILKRKKENESIRPGGSPSKY